MFERQQQLDDVVDRCTYAIWQKQTSRGAHRRLAGGFIRTRQGALRRYRTKWAGRRQNVVELCKQRQTTDHNLRVGKTWHKDKKTAGTQPWGWRQERAGTSTGGRSLHPNILARWTKMKLKEGARAHFRCHSHDKSNPVKQLSTDVYRGRSFLGLKRVNLIAILHPLAPLTDGLRNLYRILLLGVWGSGRGCFFTSPPLPKQLLIVRGGVFFKTGGLDPVWVWIKHWRGQTPLRKGMGALACRFPATLSTLVCRFRRFFPSPVSTKSSQPIEIRERYHGVL